MLISLSATLRENGYSGETAGLICMKFSGKLWSDYGTTSLHFGSIQVNRAMLISLSTTLRENGWTDLHEIFGEGVE